MLGNLFSKIRRKPKHVKDNIALASAGVFTLAVFLIWLLHVPSELINEAKEESEKTRLFTTLFSQIRDQTASVGDSLEEVIPSEVSTSTAGVENITQPAIVSSTENATGSSAFIPREVQIITTTNTSSVTTSTQSIE